MTSLQDFHLLISGMLCPENEARTQAEKQYEEIAITTRTQLLFQLFLDKGVVVEARSMCLVLLRRLLFTHWSEVWPAWGQANQEQFCEQLLKSVADEENAMLRKRLSDVIAEVARGTIDEDSGRQTWPGVLQFLEICGTSEVAVLRETGMLLLENVPSVFGCDQDQYLPGIKQMFQSTLLFASNSSVRSAAVRAYVSFMCDNDDDEKLLKSLSDQVPAVIKVCEHVVATESDDDVPLQCLCDLATTVPKILSPHLNDVLNLCSATIADKTKEDAYRHSAIEVMISLCENATGMMKKRAASVIPRIIEHCLALMCELSNDNEEWLASDDDEEDSEEESANIGEAGLDRLACCLGGKVLLAPLLQIVSRLIQNDQDWKSRHAGIMALSVIGEGCKRQMEPIIEDIVNNVVQFLTDSHPRVRFAVCNALGQMSSDFSPKLQKKCHDKVVNGLCTLLVDFSCPRVAAHAGAALVNFCEDCPKTVISTYLYQIMEKLEFVLHQTFNQLLERGKKMLLEQVITTIASVADAAQDQFVTFYDRLMPPLKYILQNANTEELGSLRGKTIECISLIGLAVGKEKFGKDANDVMQMLLANQTNLEEITMDDPQASYMMSAWARICRILGEEFAAYLPLVMPTMLKVAAMKPDVTIMSDEEAANQQSDPEWDFVPLGDQKMFGIRTVGLEEKATACEMLLCYAQELKGSFGPYIESVTLIMMPHLKFMFHDTIRSSACEIFPNLIECARDRGDAYRLQIWNAFLPAIKEAIEAEHDKSVLADQLHSISKCIEGLGATLVTQEHIETVLSIVDQQMTEYAERVVEREKEKKDDEDEDDDNDDALNEDIDEEAGVLSRISDIIHCFFKTFGQTFVPFFEKIIHHFLPLFGPRRHFTEKQWVICIFDDLIEYGGETSLKYQSTFYGPMLSGLSDEYPEVRQAAAYGFGIMAQNGGDKYAQACAEVLPHLANAISDPEARSTEEGVSATENAISAVSKILKYNSTLVDVSAVIPTFLSWLPIWDDTEEAPHVYSYLADLIEGNNPLVLGENNTNLPRVIAIIVEAFEKGAFIDAEDHNAIKIRLINIIKFIQSDSQLFQAVITNAGLSEPQVTVLHKLLD